MKISGKRVLEETAEMEETRTGRVLEEVVEMEETSSGRVRGGRRPSAGRVRGYASSTDALLSAADKDGLLQLFETARKKDGND
ncbi:unnamed protein product [Nippostrongylus brasiliensis]|uniref:Uncharacterized protein n=1 Tax=Nippostrongylus brasiliensis TaxID=27835 RepID=A0A158R1S4_NIPBR|nr:unnamed protein product [Nippostrongylus brasiliensis]